MLSNNDNPGLSSPSDVLFRAMLRNFGLIRRVMHPCFQASGVSGAQWGVLRVLHRAELTGESGLRLSDVGSRLLVRPPSVTGVVDGLERLGYVVRQTSGTDQRAKVVSLTDAGRAFVAEFGEVHARQVQRMLKGLNETQKEQLHELLERFSDHIEGMAQEVASATHCMAGTKHE